MVTEWPMSPRQWRASANRSWSYMDPFFVQCYAASDADAVHTAKALVHDTFEILMAAQDISVCERILMSVDLTRLSLGLMGAFGLATKDWRDVIEGWDTFIVRLNDEVKSRGASPSEYLGGLPCFP